MFNDGNRVAGAGDLPRSPWLLQRVLSRVPGNFGRLPYFSEEFGNEIKQ